MPSEGTNAGSWIADQVRNDKLLRRVLSRYIFIAKNHYCPVNFFFEARKPKLGVGLWAFFESDDFKCSSA